MMFTNTKHKKLLLILSIILIVLSVVFYLSKNKANKIDCTSTFYTLPDEGSWNYLEGTLSTTFFYNKTGKVMFSGTAKKGNDIFRFERLMTFHLSLIEGGDFDLYNVKITKYAEDNLDDDVFEKYVYSSTSGHIDHLVIRKINNGYLIGNMIGPRHMCVMR